MHFKDIKVEIELKMIGKDIMASLNVDEVVDDYVIVVVNIFVLV